MMIFFETNHMTFILFYLNLKFYFQEISATFKEHFFYYAKYFQIPENQKSDYIQN